RYSCRGGTSPLLVQVHRSPSGWQGIRGHEVVCDLAPALPVPLGPSAPRERLEHHAAAVAPERDRLALEPELPGQAHCLAAPVLEQFRRGHPHLRDIYQYRPPPPLSLVNVFGLPGVLRVTPEVSSMLDWLRYDVKHALRGLLRDRAFTVVALLSI